MPKLNTLSERLNDCKQYLLDEQRSKRPSKQYIADLEQTIKELEARIAKLSLWDGKPVSVMNA